ncbi:hypothetical protein EMIT07CA2_210077 [Brevibacillus sp. IT-7CA2]
MNHWHIISTTVSLSLSPTLNERIRKEKNYLLYKHKTFDLKGKKRLKVG